MLIVEHGVETAAALRSELSHAGFKVSTSSGGEDPRLAVDRDRPHVVMIDWDLSPMIGLDLLRHIRRHSAATAPRSIALSSFADEQYVVSGLELGVDDYVVKPFSVLEVVARVRALLRPTYGRLDEATCVGFRELQMDASEGRVTIHGKTLALRHLEFRLLQFLMRRPERAYTREALLLHVWGSDCRAGIRAVDVAIQRIRRVLRAHGCDEYLQTIRAVGYRLSSGAL